MLKRRLAEMAAFTLVEVVVVTGIMMAESNNYGDVKRIAYQQSCANNLRQLYQGLMAYDMQNGGLPQAAFFPKNPRQDPKSLVQILGQNWAASLVCPVFPGAIKDKGLTYLYNDSLAGQSLDQIENASETWLLVEMNAISPEVPMPHPGGFNTLYADGQVKVTKKIPDVFVEMQKKAAAEKETQPPTSPTPVPAPAQ